MSIGKKDGHYFAFFSQKKYVKCISALLYINFLGEVGKLYCVLTLF